MQQSLGLLFPASVGTTEKFEEPFPVWAHHWWVGNQREEKDFRFKTSRFAVFGGELMVLITLSVGIHHHSGFEMTTLRFVSIKCFFFFFFADLTFWKCVNQIMALAFSKTGCTFWGWDLNLPLTQELESWSGSWGPGSMNLELMCPLREPEWSCSCS